MDDVEITAAATLCLLSLYNYVTVLKRKIIKKRRKKRLWMTSIHQNRTRSSMENIFQHLTSEESGEFFNFCRMSSTDFEFLLTKIEPKIKKQRKLRVPILPKIRLAITLRYLASGDSYRRLHTLFMVSTAVISLIVPEICLAIVSVLKNKIRLPQIPEEWLAIEKGFRGTFPQCVGAIDGKRIAVKSPAQGGSEGYKATPCMVLTSLIDSDYRFIFADISDLGRASEGEKFQNSLLWQTINTDTINLPSDSSLPGRETKVSFCFHSDGAFTCHKRIMKPFPDNPNVGTVERIFNDKLCSTRAIVDNVFGVLTSVFRVFKKPIEIDHEKVPLVTMTCILLHNFLRKSESSRDIYTPPGTFDSLADGKQVNGSWRQDLNSFSAFVPISNVDNISSTLGTSNVVNDRLEFANYFHNVS